MRLYDAMNCTTLHFSRHAFERMFQRGINPEVAAQIIIDGEIIADYPEDQPYSSTLLLGFYEDKPVHAVVAHETETGECHLVTIYGPDPAIWDDSFKRRRACEMRDLQDRTNSSRHHDSHIATR